MKLGNKVLASGTIPAPPSDGGYPQRTAPNPSQANSSTRATGEPPSHAASGRTRAGQAPWDGSHLSREVRAPRSDLEAAAKAAGITTYRLRESLKRADVRALGSS
jgi:hypothetical protein